MFIGDALKDSFEEAVEYLVERNSDASELKDMLVEKLADVIDYGFEGVDDAIYEATNSPDQENALSSMRREIRDEAVSRLAEKYMVTLTKIVKEKVNINSPYNVVGTFNESRESDDISS